MKKYLLSTAVAVVFLVPLFVFADTTLLVPCDGPDCQICHVVQLGQNILTWLISIVAIIIAIVFVIGGLKMVMAAGNEGEITKARSMMTSAIIGFVILLAAWLILDTVMKYFVEDSFSEGYGPWNEIQCVDQPEFVAKAEWGIRGSSENWDITPAPAGSLTDISFEDTWGPLGDRPRWTDEDIFSYSSDGVSVAIQIPELDQNYALSVNIPDGPYEVGALYGELSTTRVFGSGVFDSEHFHSSLENWARVILTPADAGKYIYFNYRPESPVQGGSWQSVPIFSFRKTSEHPKRANPTQPGHPLDPGDEYPIVTLSGRTVDWISVFGSEFGRSGRVQNDLFPGRGYRAIEFNTGDVKDSGVITNIERPGSNVRLAAISRTPGNFNVREECRSRSTDSRGGLGILWTTVPGVEGACGLNSNTTYYVNITFTDGRTSNSTNASDGDRWMVVKNN